LIMSLQLSKYIGYLQTHDFVRIAQLRKLSSSDIEFVENSILRQILYCYYQLPEVFDFEYNYDHILLIYPIAYMSQNIQIIKYFNDLVDSIISDYHKGKLSDFVHDQIIKLDSLKQYCRNLGFLSGCSNSNITFIDYLQSIGPINLDHTDEEGNTGYLLACLSNIDSPEILIYLEKLGLDPYQKNIYGSNAWAIVCVRGKKIMGKYLEETKDKIKDFTQLIIPMRDFALAEDLGQLTNLTQLNLSNGEKNLYFYLDNKNPYKKIQTYKELSTNPEINLIPNSIEKLTQLKELILTNNLGNKNPKKKFGLSLENSYYDYIANLDLHVLRVDFNQLNFIPAIIFNMKNLIELNLSNNNIVDIPKEIKFLTKLQNLNFKSNRIIIIPKLIGKLTNLSTLNLYKNKIKELPDEFKLLTNLTQLNLGRNSIDFRTKKIDIFKFLSPLTKLKELDLSSNGIFLDKYSEFVNYTGLINIEKLNMENTFMDEIPSILYHLTNLKSLNLSSIKSFNIISISSSIQNLTKLSKLKLAKNTKINSLPPEIKYLTKLEKLTLDQKMAITLDQKMDISIPNEIFELSNLKELFLIKLLLVKYSKGISYDISNLKNLEIFYGNLYSYHLTDDDLEIIGEIDKETSLIEKIDCLTKLKKIVVSGILTEYFSPLKYSKSLERISKFPNLYSLNITNTKLTREHTSIIYGMTNLQELSLFNCDLDKLSKKISNLSNLTLLCLARNNLNTIPKELYLLTKLKKLCLKSNKIEIIPNGLISLENLEEIDVVNNKLKFVSQELLFINNLKKINIYQNSWNIPNVDMSLSFLIFGDIHDKIYNVPCGIKKIYLIKSQEKNIQCSLPFGCQLDYSLEEKLCGLLNYCHIDFF
jgi:Leucine-rich repeat (LRR) protein